MSKLRIPKENCVVLCFQIGVGRLMKWVFAIQK